MSTVTLSTLSAMLLLTGSSSCLAGFMIGKKRRSSGSGLTGDRSATSGNTEEALKLESLMVSLRAMTSEVKAQVGEHSERIDEITQSIQSGEADSGDILAAGDLLVSANQLLQSQLAEAKAEIDRQRSELGRSVRDAMTDPLTGVSNRRAFDQEIAQLIALHRRRSVAFSLIMVDIDHFKRVNDQNGHMVGDKVLKAIARNLTNTFRDTDFIGRFGGEEFAVILPRTPLLQAADAAERSRVAISACEGFGSDVVLEITASFGVAEISGNEADGAIIQRADEALYAAKKGGRNRVFIHDGTAVKPRSTEDDLAKLTEMQEQELVNSA